MTKSVLVFLALSVAFSMAFWADLQGYFSAAPNPVASLVFADGTVRRLAAGQMTWDRAGRGTLFAKNDTISTGEGASAKLLFDAGGEVDLGPGAMVVIGGDLEDLRLNFLSGTAKVRIAKSAQKKIQLSSSSAQSAPGRVVVETVEDQSIAKMGTNLEREAVQSTLEIAARANEQPLTAAFAEKKIKDPSKVMASDGEILSVSRMPSAPELLYPANEALVDLGLMAGPVLQWNPRDSTSVPPSHYELILKGLDEGAKPKVFRSEAPTISVNQMRKMLAQGKLGLGKYRWSVRSVSKEGLRSPAAKTRWVEFKQTARISSPTVLPVKVQ